jgi:hypothetical protein
MGDAPDGSAFAIGTWTPIARSVASAPPDLKAGDDKKQCVRPGAPGRWGWPVGRP